MLIFCVQVQDMQIVSTVESALRNRSPLGILYSGIFTMSLSDLN